LNVLFCLPGNSFSNNFLGSWTELLMSLSKNGINPLLSMAQDAVVYYVRNKCLAGNTLQGPNQKPFDGKLPYDYMMWIDSDIVFRPEQFYTLLGHKKDIISGIYMMEGGRNFAAVKKWDKEFFAKHGYFEFMTIEDTKTQGLVEVDYSGLGFMLVKHGVFESLEYPWFRPIFHTIGTATDFSSEDVSFCTLAKQKGYSIYVDPSVRVGHEKKVIL
jgi:hypothetical protein